MNNDERHTELEPTLVARDAAAVDALIEAGFVVSRIPASAERKRISRLTSLLGLLRAGPGADAALVDVTLARVLKAGGSGPGDRGELRLSQDDQEAFDALVMSGFDAARVPGALRERARRQEAVLSALVPRNAPDVGDLIDRTLTRVQDHINRHENVYNLNEARARRGSGLRLRDLVSVAAVVLIGSAVLFPVMTSMREQSRRALCKTNLGSTALALGTYAGANRDSLPVSTASLMPGGTWWQVGKEPRQSNSANLFTLTRAGYVPLSTLACPGNPSAPTATVSPGALDWRRLEEVSYSYQIMFGPQRPSWNAGPSSVVLADRSPVVLRAIRGEAVDPCSNAPNHACAGQHMLLNDASVSWAISPILPNGDNIWLPRSIEIRIRQLTGQRPMSPLHGNETPEAVDDTFLGP